MDFQTSGRVKPESSEDDFSLERRSVTYFCRRIQPKLSELKDFQNLKGFQESKVSQKSQLYAKIITLLKWRDDGSINVREEFREFYDGLLFFCNLRDTRLPRPLRELVDIFFETHGSDPRSFPEAMGIALRLFNQALKKFTPDWQENGLWAVLSEASFAGSQAADMLRTSLEHYKTMLPSNSLGDPYGKLIRGEEWTRLPFAYGFSLVAANAKFRACKDVLAWLTSKENRRSQAQKEHQLTLETPLGAITNAVDQGINAELLPPDLETDSDTQIFVGPSGCGKTTKIQSLLKRDWGLYLLPANISQESDESDPMNRLEYKSRRGNGSRDTQTSFEYAKSLQELGLLSLPGAITQALQILTTRLWILEQFRELNPYGTPYDWLKLQTNCREPRNDMSNHLYRVLRFDTRNIPTPRRAFNSKLIFCFDEAQCDLPEIPPGEMKWPLCSETIRPFACMYLAAVMVNGHFNDPENLTVFLSGTALQLRHMQRVIKNYAAFVTTVADMSWSTASISDLAPKVNRDFRLVNEQSFKKLLDAREHHYDEELLGMIIQHSKLLHGRVVWSVCYLNAIEKLVDSQRRDQKKVLVSHIKEVSVRVCEIAKRGLKERLRDMRRSREVDQLPGLKRLAGAIALSKDETTGKSIAKGVLEKVGLGMHDLESVVELGLELGLGSDLKHQMEEMKRRTAMDQRLQNEGLIDELCSLAIRSDLLGEATIFKSSESADLIAFGFAFLDEPQDSSGSRVKLKEKLAVDAAIEYFQQQKLSNGQSEYDRALVNFLYSEQSNASALGKVAELFFAWHLKKVLGTCADMIIPTLGDDYRTQVLQLLIGNARTVEDLETKGTGSDLRSHITGHAGNLSTFRLVEGKRTAYQEEVDGDRTVTMWDWLRNIRYGKHGEDLRSTFWFPSNKTGPDVVFALKSETPKALKESKSEALEKKTPETGTSLPYRHETWQRAGGKRKKGSGDAGELDYSLVLCVVQIKREKKISDIGRAIATTDPNYWFSNNYPHHTLDALRITEELREWQKGRYPIVRILVSALTGSKQYTKAEEGSTTAEKYFINKAIKTNKKSSEEVLVKEGREEDLQEVRIPFHQQYYTSIGAEHDDLLFGDAFRRLREAQGVQTARERKGKAPAAEIVSPV